MAEPKPADRDTAATPTDSESDARSEGLLPGIEGLEDGRFGVAEEVSLDQQSDEARRIGQGQSNGIADALPESLKTPVPSQAVPDKP